MCGNVVSTVGGWVCSLLKLTPRVISSCANAMHKKCNHIFECYRESWGRDRIGNSSGQLCWGALSGGALLSGGAFLIRTIGLGDPSYLVSTGVGALLGLGTVFHQSTPATENTLLARANVEHQANKKRKELAEQIEKKMQERKRINDELKALRCQEDGVDGGMPVSSGTAQSTSSPPPVARRVVQPPASTKDQKGARNGFVPPDTGEDEDDGVMAVSTDGKSNWTGDPFPGSLPPPSQPFYFSNPGSARAFSAGYHQGKK